MFKETIEALVKEEDELNEIRQKTGWVTEKKGKVVRRSEFAPEWIIGDFVIRGKIYSALAQMILPLRTLFLKKSLKINGTPFYLEIKGYGFEGRELYFQEHVSGDVYYGMYLEKALMEFKRIELAMSLGILTPLPIAVVEIPRSE